MLNRFKYNASHTKHNKTCQLWTHENHAVYLYSPGFKKGVVKKTTPSGGLYGQTLMKTPFIRTHIAFGFDPVSPLEILPGNN